MQNLLNLSIRELKKLASGVIKNYGNLTKQELINGLSKQQERAIRRYVITTAISDTEVNRDFLRTLEFYCETNDAELIVCPIKYKNAEAEGDYSYSPLVAEYLQFDEMRLSSQLVLAANVNVSPTAARPLSGFEGYGKGLSVIVPHVKVALTCVPMPQTTLPRTLISTGAVTQPRYSTSKAGAKAKFHHSFSALLVEVDTTTERFYLRHLHFDGMGIADLGEYYTESDVYENNVAALVLGDTHVGNHCPLVEKATFGKDGLVELTQPETLVWHDVLDFASRSHHATLWQNYSNAQKRVEDEVNETLNYVAGKSGERKVVIVASNHNTHLQKWLTDADWKTDPANARYYLKLAAMKLEAISSGDNSDIFDLISRDFNENWSVPGVGGSHVIAGIEVGQHGDKGSNGARGSALAFARSSVKTVTGHSHSPAIADGAYVVGTSTKLNMGYNAGGLSSWMNGHCVIHSNGKRQIILIIDGKFQA